VAVGGGAENKKTTDLLLKSHNILKITIFSYNTSVNGVVE
jgi:hypothetical protein